jgi:hypothetical protein
MFMLFMVGINNFLTIPAYAKEVQYRHLSPEQIKKAQDSANKTAADAMKSIESQKGYNIGEIITVILLNLLFLAVLSLITWKLRKYRLGRILYLPIIFLCVLLFNSFLFIFGFIHALKF